MFREFSRKVRWFAEEVVAGRLRPHVDFELHDEDWDLTLMLITDVAENGWMPSFGMIDGCDAERNAMEAVFDQEDQPFVIRACQFHVIQAVRSFAKRTFTGAKKERDERVRRFLNAFRACQRCPNVAEWPRYWNQLRDHVRLIDNDAGSAWEALSAYLLKEWFSERWREKVCDYGMPAEWTRDGSRNTNNFAESIFRTFKRAFLNHRANKRFVTEERLELTVAWIACCWS
jgi:hypothetical protein